MKLQKYDWQPTLLCPRKLSEGRGYYASEDVDPLLAELETLREEKAKYVAVIEEVNAWAVCCAITDVADMMQNITRIVEITSLQDTDILNRKPADELADTGDLYADVYCQIVDMIEPYIWRDFPRSSKPKDALPASVVDSVKILFDFWIKHKGGV